MANMFNKGLSFFGLADPEEIQDDEPIEQAETVDETDFDRDDALSMQSARLAAAGRGAAQSSNSTFPKSAMNRITTIHPRSYDEVQSVGRALRDGVPVVLNLTGVADKDATRIIDFATGVVFGVRGSVERVTPRVWLLSPAAVTIRQEQVSAVAQNSGIFE